MKFNLHQLALSVWSIIAVAVRTVRRSKAVQYGTVTIAVSATSGTATITSVDTARAVLHMLGWSTDFNSGSHRPDATQPRITLTNSTTVTATRGVGLVDPDTVTVSFVVDEGY